MMYQFFSKRCFMLAWLALWVLLISQFFGKYFWQIELFSHFVPHYTVVLLLAIVCYPKTQNQIFRYFFAVIACGLGVWLYLPYQSISQNPQNLQGMTIGYQNVNINNQNYQQVLESISNQGQADILILLEASSQWRDRVKSFDNNYQFVCGNDEHSPFALQIFAKMAINCEMINLAEFPMAKLLMNDGRTIFAVHPPPPITAYLANARLQYLDKLAILAKQSTMPTLIIGDMNLSAFSPVFRDFQQKTSFYQSTKNGLPTWLPLGIGIDQVLSNRQYSVQITPLNWYGSDHRGFFIYWLN